MAAVSMDHTFRTDALLRAFFDFGFIAIGVVVAALWIGNGLPIDLTLLMAFSITLAVTMLAINTWLGLYQQVHNRTIADTRARGVLALHLSIPLAYLIFAVMPMAEMDRHFLELASLAAIFGVLSNRVVTAHCTSCAIVVRRILIYGAGNEALGVADSLSLEDRSIEVVGYYPASDNEVVVVPQEMLLPHGKTLIDTVREREVDEIVVAMSERRGGKMNLRELLDCRLEGVLVLDLPSHFERMLGQIRLDALKAGWLIFGDGFRQGVRRTLVKRVFDYVSAIVLIIIFSPLMLLTALLIALEDGFPVLYRQERVGLNGRLFNVIKFRSMRRDAESDGKPRWASANDSRVTRVGRIIRKLRIDELPQLFSVLKGDMSMVGPRPERAYFVDQLTQQIPFYAVRHSVKPGVTGWAQVRFPYGASVDDAMQKLQYDLYYVKNHSLLLDLIVLFDTVGVVVGGKGAQ